MDSAHPGRVFVGGFSLPLKDDQPYFIEATSSVFTGALSAIAVLVVLLLFTT
jgi:hypothetical protein